MINRYFLFFVSIISFLLLPGESYALKYGTLNVDIQYDGPVDPGDVNQKLVRVSITVTAGGGTPSCQGMDFTVPGYTEVATMYLYATGQTPTFTSPTLLSTKVPSAGMVNFSGFNYSNNASGTWYYWVFFDANPSITNDVKIDANYVSGTYGSTGPTLGTLTPTGFRLTGRNYKIGTGENYATILETAQGIARFDYDGAADIVMEMTANYANPVESAIAFSAHTGPANIILRPQAGQTGKITRGDPGTGAFFLQFNNGASAAQKIILDGRPGGTGTSQQWTIRNSRTAATIGGAIGFSNGANNNTLTYLNIEADISVASGIIYFATSTAAGGNNYNTISHCIIRDWATADGGTATLPMQGIYSSGSVGKNNYGNVVDNCEFVNIYNPAAANSSAIIMSANSDGWTISNNHFYQTTAYPNLANSFSVISIVSGGGYTITGNYIGGSAPNCGGAAYNIPIGTFEFYGIAFNSATTGTPNIVSNNTISNLAYTTAMTSTIYPMGGILLQGASSVTCNGNTIGSMSSTGNIVLTNNAGSGSYGFSAIFCTATGTNTITNNNIGGISVGGSHPGATTDLIMNSSGAGTSSIENNIIGGSVANSINITSNSQVNGIVSNSANGLTAKGNIIQNINSSATTASLYGIINTSGTLTASSNNFKKITSSSNASHYMIYHTGSTAAISGNYMEDILLSNTGNTSIFYGIFINSASSVSCISNTIGSTTPNNIQTAGNAISAGIQKNGTGVLTCNKNIIQQILCSSTGTGNSFVGINIASGSGALDASEDTIQNITTNSTKAADVLTGVSINSTDLNHLIRKFHIEKLISNTATADVRVHAINLYAGGGTVSKCLIKGLENKRPSSLASNFGIWLEPGTWNIYNNVMMMDNGSNTNDVKLYGIYDNTTVDNKNIYHNTIKISGTVSSGSTPTTCYRKVNTSPAVIINNIFQNTRSGGTGGHYAIYSNTTITENNNYLEVTENSAKLGNWGGINKDFAGWIAASGGTSDISGTILVNDTGLVTTIPFAGAGKGANLTATITDDKIGITRGKASWMGAYEGQNITVGTISPLAYCLPASIPVNYTVGGNGNFNGGNIFTAQLSDASGSFVSPLNIGSLASTTSGTISATVPANLGIASYTIFGAAVWTCPAGITSVTVECWGGGGGGGGSKAGVNNSGGGGGAGGSYARKTLSVTPGNNYNLYVGNGGNGGLVGNAGMGGGDSWFNNATTIKGQGGTGGSPGMNGFGGIGSSTSSIGDIVYAGGNGAKGVDNFYAGGGGGGAGSTGNGGNAFNTTPGTGTAVGGGNGGTGGGPINYSGVPGSSFGGGGSGGYRQTIDQGGGPGSGGKVLITYNLVPGSYRIRVVSSDPVITGSDNGNNLFFNTAAPGSPTANAASTITCNGFYANWNTVAGAVTYYLDVATDAGFSAFVTGYNNLDVGDVVTYQATGLVAGTTYYYRVRAGNGCGISGNSGTQSALTNGSQRVLVVSNNANGTTTDGVSLRWAITEANSNCGHDSIQFGFGAGGPFTINLTAALPDLTGAEGVTIDGFNNSWCALQGTVSTNGTTSVTGSGTMFTVEISPGDLININGEKRTVATVPGNSSLTVTTAFSLTATNQKAYKVCTSANNGTPNSIPVFSATTGTPMNPVYKIVLGNGGTVATGLVIQSGSNYNIIKGLVLQDFGDGSPTANDIAITINGNNNQILGCYIGMDATGTTRGTKTADGIVISGANNFVGDGTAAGANLISGMNGNLEGILIAGAGATGNRIRGNMIGLQKDGTTIVSGAAQYSGIYVMTSALNNTIGGSNAGEGNVISGNNNRGFTFYTAANGGNKALGNIIGPAADGSTNPTSNPQIIGIMISSSPDNIIGGSTATERNIISANGSYGVDITGAGSVGNIIKGNYIGINKNGTAFITGSSQDYGVAVISSAGGNTIGGSAAGEGNLVSGNIYGVSFSSIITNGNTVIGNIIGPQADGLSYLASNPQVYGVNIVGSPNNIIGGNTAGARNVISANGSAGIYITNAESTGNIIKGNYIGIDKNGTSFITGSTQDIGINFLPTCGGNNIVGGSGSGEGNVISGNKDGTSTGTGIVLGSSAAAGNTVLGNIIGPQADGVTYLTGNGQYYGIDVNNSPNNTIGGNTAGARNIVSANEFCGIQLEAAGSTGNIVKGNYIGIDKNGTTFISNSDQDYGVLLLSNCGGGNALGGSGANEGNVISGNKNVSSTARGIWCQSTAAAGNSFKGNIIGPQADGVTYLSGNLQYTGLMLDNSRNNVIGGNTVNERNIISANESYGIYLGGASCTGNMIKGNFLGIETSGTSFITGSTQNYGVYITSSAASNTIGGSGAGEGNVISGNSNCGVVTNSTAAGGNTITGNIIGPQWNGISKLVSNSQIYGVYLNDSRNNIIGGSSSAERNIISANTYNGIEITGASSTGNIIKGNYIGLDKNGTTFIPGNTQSNGIYISFGANSNTVGGSGAGEGNLISGNIDVGIYFTNSGDNNIVRGNIIGPQADGVSYVGSNAQNYGLVLDDSPNSTIGGTSANERNIISANEQIGIFLLNLSSTGNDITGNYIGPSASLTNITGSSQDYGVNIDLSAANNTIGGAAAGSENQIAFNIVNGIYLYDAATTGNLISKNPIYSNTGKAINLNYGASQGNNGKAIPVISTASTVNVSGTSEPNNIIEVFKNTTGDCNDATTFVGSTTADGSGNWSMAVTLSECDYVLATATDLSNNTSEFSACVKIPPTSLTTSAIVPTSYCAGGPVSVPFTVPCDLEPGNIFTAQLSDAAGSFATPTVIGTLSSQTSGTIAAEIPSATPAGAGYRIRVISSNPSITGSDNGTDISISVCSRYWIDNAGNWNDPAHWSTSSGGASGASVPHKGVYVYLDNNSFTGPGQIITVPAGNWYMKSISFTGYGQNAVFIGQGAMVVGQ